MESRRAARSQGCCLYSWTPGSSIPAGTYNVALGVFNSNWTYNYYWNGSAATITVTQ